MNKSPKGIKCPWMSCPYCRKVLGGTDRYHEIKSFPRGKGLEEHMKICQYKEVN